MVVTNSPAQKVELRKHDVLVAFDGQMLVDPEQLRKLVQMHAEGDEIKLTYYRRAKRKPSPRSSPKPPGTTRRWRATACFKA